MYGIFLIVGFLCGYSVCIVVRILFIWLGIFMLCYFLCSMFLLLIRNVLCLMLCMFLLYIFFILIVLKMLYMVLLVLEISLNGIFSFVLKFLCDFRLLCEMLNIMVLVVLKVLYWLWKFIVFVV